MKPLVVTGRPLVVTVTVRGKFTNPLNSARGEHYGQRSSRDGKQRRDVGWALMAAGTPPVRPVVVTLTRHSTGCLDAHDGLPASLKVVVDCVARWLGVDDASKSITWEYRQKKCKRGEERVVIQTEHLFIF